MADKNINVPTVQSDTPLPEPGTTLLLENGTRLTLYPHEYQNPTRPAFRVFTDSGAYDHCSEDPETGEWMYRKSA